jgi:hypothetical protein
MGLFKKKSDPISQRAQALAEEIAALEAQIQKLSAQDKRFSSQETPTPAPPPAPSPAQPPAPPASPQPRLRSTALPHHRQAVPTRPAPAPPSREPVFEEVDQNRLQSEPEAAPPQPSNRLDVRKSDLNAFWRRLITHFRGPPTSNPKLVNYLAAGSIQGLRPLRYERRVARNRFIFFFICLVVVLWGLIAMFWKSHR